ncbi:uncharacterized protein LOC132742323 [Ruditapes philippinarum]|uniref:uncharacterized protein LOC132742323 n=1 Tax=Ruditapes philippinarum TaxID=129788 RepID=UPI00295B2815|nr:uncharacterized protein LOC132742323 [Ruditapes philippinarum]
MSYYLSVVQYALFASIAFMFLGILLILVKHCLLKEWKHEKQQMVLGFISAAFAFLTGILAVLAFGIFHVELVLDGYSLHAGFYLTVIAWLLSWVTGSIFLVDSICIGAKMYPDLK